MIPLVVHPVPKGTICVPKTKRDLGILAEWKAGATYAALGRKHGVSAVRIRQIVKKMEMG